MKDSTEQRTAGPARRTVADIKRLTNSRDGNPTWKFTFTDGSTARTHTNADIGYEVTSGWIGRTFTVTFERGSIVAMVEVQP